MHYYYWKARCRPCFSTMQRSDVSGSLVSQTNRGRRTLGIPGCNVTLTSTTTLYDAGFVSVSHRYPFIISRRNSLRACRSVLPIHCFYHDRLSKSLNPRTHNTFMLELDVPFDGHQLGSPSPNSHRESQVSGHHPEFRVTRPLAYPIQWRALRRRVDRRVARQTNRCRE